jgi:hypothetical protein
MRKCNLFFVLAFLSVVNVQFQTEPSGLFNIHDSLSWLIYSCLLKDCIILYLSTHSEEERHFGKPWLAQAFHYYINNSPLSSSYGDMTIAILTVCKLLPLKVNRSPPCCQAWWQPMYSTFSWASSANLTHTLKLLLVWKSPPGCAPLRILLMSRWNQTRWGCPGKKMSSVIFRTLSYNVFLTHFQVLGPKQITKQLNLCRPSGKESFLCTLSYTFLVRCCRKHFTKV